jgi:hypothetical protein
MLKESTGLWSFPIIFGSGRSKLIPHLVEGDGDNLFHREDFDSSPNIVDASVDAMMDLFSSPGLTVLQVLQDINLPSSFRGILEPAIPETVIGKPILSGAGFEGFIPAFGPGEFVLESGHRSWISLTEAASKPIFLIILHRWGKISSSVHSLPKEYLDFPSSILYNFMRLKAFSVNAFIHQPLTVTRLGSEEVVWSGSLNRPHF